MAAARPGPKKTTTNPGFEPVAPSQPMVVVQQQQAQGGGTGPRPIGVTIIAIFQFITGAALVFPAIFFLIGGAFIEAFFEGAFPDWLSGIILAASIVFAIIFLLLAAAFILVGVGTMRGSGWAWTLTIVLSIIFGAFSLLGLFGGDPSGIPGTLLTVAIYGLIIWYYFTAGVKRFFGKSEHRALWQRGG